MTQQKHELETSNHKYEFQMTKAVMGDVNNGGLLIPENKYQPFHVKKKEPNNR